MFLQDIKDNAQQIIFCGVGAHHQNGIAEKKIRDLVKNARTQLIQAMHLWPGVIKKVLWPLALMAVVRSHNKFKLDANLLSPGSCGKSVLFPHLVGFHSSRQNIY